MADPLVSYVVAAYNHEAYIGELLRSISEQTFDRMEIVVVDDGSTDRTLEIARQAVAADPRITIHAQPNSGVVAARNTGVERSSAAFISVVDSDDVLPPDRTAKMVRALQNDPLASFVYGDAKVVRKAEGETLRFFEIYPPIAGSVSEALFCNYCFVPASAVMFRRESFVRSGLFWGPGPNTDYLKWIELGLYGNGLCLPDDILGTWVLHGKNVSQVDADARCAQYQALCDALIQLARKHPRFAEELGQRRINKRCSRCYQMAGFYAARERKWRLAARQFHQASRYEKSLGNLALSFSTLPFVNLASGVAYDLAARIRLREHARPPAELEN